MTDRPEYVLARDLTAKLHAAMTAHGGDSPEAEAVRDEFDAAGVWRGPNRLNGEERNRLGAYAESLYAGAEAEAVRTGVPVRD